MKKYIHNLIPLKILTLLLLSGLLFFQKNEASAQCNPDTQPPMAVCAASSTVSLQAGQPAILLPVALDMGSSDNCTAPPQLQFRMEDGPASAVPPPATSLTFGESDIGTHTVTLWVIDEAGNAGHCTTNLHVMDDCGGGSPANLACNDSVTVQLVGGQTACIYPGAILEGGPYCNTYKMTLNPPGTAANFLVFDETHLGTHIVQVKDLVTGNSCWGTIEVDSTGPCSLPDETLPVPVCKNGLVVELPAGLPPQVEIFASGLDAGSTDYCTLPGNLERRIEEASTPSAQPPATGSVVLTGAGAHDVVLWTGDEAGNWAYCQTTVVLSDCINSQAMACNDSLTINVSSSQPVNFYPQDMLAGGPYCYDQMAIGILFSGPLQPYLSFGPGDTGVYIVQVTYLPSGNSCWGTVEVISNCDGETTPPVAVCDQNPVVQLGLHGPNLTYVEAAELNDGSWDNCTAPADLQFAIEAGPPAASMPSATQLAFTAPGTYPNVVM